MQFICKSTHKLLGECGVKEGTHSTEEGSMYFIPIDFQLFVNVRLINFQIKPSTPSCISVIQVEFNPTVPHCNLATIIGLCIRIKLERALVDPFKLDIYIKEGTHSTEEESMYFIPIVS